MYTVRLSPGEAGRGVATTALRVVHAVQVFRVEGWYWYNDQEHGLPLLGGIWDRRGSMSIVILHLSRHVDYLRCFQGIEPVCLVLHRSTKTPA